MERYAAFISYSHADEGVARWLHRAIENYRFPRALVGQESEFGRVPRKLPPVFRDRDELPASADLGSELRAALAAARFQIVLCSPAAARSHWVNEEILQYKRMHGESRTLALIVDGEPYSGGETECFPEALRYRVDADGKLTDEPAEPIAADIRQGKDGRRLALQKLLAGLAGVKLDMLVRREAARRQRRLAIVATASTAIAFVTIGLAIYAELQRREAVEQRELADRSLDFLVGTFEVANPATENPRTITAVTILERASRRAAEELQDEPAISGRLLRTTGSIYFNLGLHEEAERDYHAALEREAPFGEGRAAALLDLAALARQRYDVDAAADYVDQAEAAYDHDASYAPPLNAQLVLQRGNILYLRADYSEAARRYAETAELYRQMDEDYRADYAYALGREAEARVQARQFEQARGLFDAAARVTAEIFGNRDVRTARALQNQAFASFQSGEPDEARAALQRAIAIYDNVLEGDHPTMALAQMLLGRIETAREDPASALAAFAASRDLFAKLYGPTSPTVGDVAFFAAEAETQAGRYAAALERAAQAKAIYDLNYGPDDPDQAEVLLLQARILTAAGRPVEAQLACRNATELQVRIGVEEAIRDASREECARLSQLS